MADEPDGAGPKQLRPWQFKRGQSGNPAGRKKGVRSKLSEQFLLDLYEAWMVRGEEVITAVIEDNPEAFLRIIARLMPQHVKLSDERDSLTDEQRATRLMGVLRTLYNAGALDAALGAVAIAGGGGIHRPDGDANQLVIDVSPVQETAPIPLEPDP